jgi:hypothetical protein
MFYHPAEGNIWTLGTQGIKEWNGSFYGQFTSPPLMVFTMGFYPGVKGFSGLRLRMNTTDYYFGFALNVTVGPNHL